MKIIFRYSPAGMHKFSSYVGTTSKLCDMQQLPHWSTCIRPYVSPYKM